MKRLLVCVIITIFLSACQSANFQANAQVIPSVTHTVTLKPTLSPEIIAQQSEVWDAWEKSPHAHTYDLSKGQNTYCAQCHSPHNWDPKAYIDSSPNCVSCKLASEESPRMAEHNPLVPKEAWQNIGCNVCHDTDGGLYTANIAWWGQEIGEYETVADSTALCEKCHRDTEVLSHQLGLGSPAHHGFKCTDCHNAHSTVADCTNAGCHGDIFQMNDLPPATPTDGHPTGSLAFCGGLSCHIAATEVAKMTQSIHSHTHAAITCVACHDASGLQVNPIEGGGAWVTWRTTVLYGDSVTRPYQSHSIQLEVDCKRCHFEGNFWNLQAVTGDEFIK